MRIPFLPEPSTTRPNVMAAMMLPTMMPACLLAGAALGYLADKQMGWQPWGIRTGVLLGFLAGLRETILIVKRISRKKTQ